MAARRSSRPWVALEGPSGVGKTTLLRALVRATGRVGLAEAVDRVSRPPRLTFRTPGDLARIEARLVALELERFADAVGLARQGRSVFLDTGFAGPLAYSAGLAAVLGPRWDVRSRVAERLADALAAGGWGVPDLTLYLDASPQEIARRAGGDPRGHPAELARRHARVGAEERRLWLGPVLRALPHRVSVVSAEGPVPAVARRVIDAVARAQPIARPGEPDARRMIAALLDRRASASRQAVPETVMKPSLTRRPLRR